MHRDSVNRINPQYVPTAMMPGARECWDDCVRKRQGETGIDNGPGDR
jgi:hypothetical protein